MSGDILTVLRCGPESRATKVIENRTVVRDYNCGQRFSVEEIPVSSFDEMAGTLDRISRDPRRFVIRGRPLPGIDRSWHSRRSAEKWGATRAYESCARRWLGIDVDSVAEPAGLDFAQEPEEGVEHVIGLLPDPFSDVSCLWQCTSSAGIKPGIRCRLWFWLSRPVSDAQCKGWLPGAPVVDSSIYQPVGVHYTAPRIIRSGPDPVARRQGIRRGLDDTVEVPAELPRGRSRAAAPVTLTGADLDETQRKRLAGMIRGTRTAWAIWNGERTYSDRSRKHFAFTGALLKAGIFDGFNDDWQDMLAFALVRLAEHHGEDMGKASRRDYLEMTIGNAIADEAAKAESSVHGAAIAASIEKGAAG
jgi:hypothetical protein